MKPILKHTVFIFFVLLVVLATTLSSCKSAGVVPPTTTQTNTTVTVKEIIRDTFFTTKKDSSYYKAYLDCVDGKVTIVGNRQKAIGKSVGGNYLLPPKVQIQDNILQVDCQAEAQKLFYQWKDIYRQNLKSVVQTNYVSVPKPLSYWQRTQIFFCRLFLTLLMLLLLGILYQKRKFFNY